VNEAAKPPRDFTYIRPSKGRLSEYEAVTCFTQPDPDVMDAPGWFIRSSEGRPAWLRDSTHLKHRCWFDFRDPAGMWQRSYVRMQAEQERALELLVEQARSAGTFKDFHPTWISLMLGGHYRVWTYFEYGMFRAFAQAQREALSDTLGNVFSFEAVDRFKDGGGKQEWLSSPIYQPARRMTEQVMTLTDWGELAVRLIWSSTQSSARSEPASCCGVSARFKETSLRPAS
jgi:methane monooxygenase component A beta chain/propane monooxygenase small subunit